MSEKEQMDDDVGLIDPDRTKVRFINWRKCVGSDKDRQY